MSELVGTARVELTLDSTQFVASAERSKNAAHGMGAEAEAAFSGLEGRAKRAAASILQYGNSYGLAAEQARLNNAALRGAPLEIVEAVAQKIREQHAAQVAAAQSSRELAAAEAARASREAGHLAMLERMNDGIRRMKQDAARAAIDASNKEKAAGDVLVASLQRQAQAIGKTRVELLELQAAELKVSSAAAPFIAQLKAQEKQLQATGIAFNQYGLSAKQTSAALRQVPAQLTDIFVSLQGGQNPLTVFLQQGGQLRDVFGGAMPALRAMGAQLLSMVNVWTVSAAVIGTAAVAWYQATEEQRKFADALLMTGNRINSTSDNLANMAEKLDDLAGTTRGEAAAAMTEILGIGQFTEAQFAVVTEAALKMQYATGKAVSDTAAEFEKLRRDPVAAIAELGTQYGYLDQALLDNIRNLVRNGEEQRAAQLAIEAHANMINQRTPEIVANMGLVQGALHGIGNAAKETWDEATGLFSRMDKGLAEFVNRAKNYRAEMAGFFTGQMRAQFGMQGENIPALPVPGGPAKPTPEQIAAQNRFRAQELQYLDEAARHQENLNKIRADGLAGNIGAARINAAIAAAQAQYDERQAARAKKGGAQSLENAELRAGLQEYKDILAQEQNAIQNSSSILEAEYSARLVDAETYYDRQRALVTDNYEAQERALTGQIAFLRSRDVAGKEAVDVQRQLGELEAKLAQVRADGTTKLAVLGIQETATAKQRQQAIDAYLETLERANETLQRQVNAEIESIGVGTRVAEQQRAIADAYAYRDERLRELQDRLERDNDRGMYEAGLAALERSTNERVRIITDGFRRMDEARASWQNGMTAGLQNWMEEASNVATQVQQIWENSLDRTTAALVEFAETGRLEWRSFLADILKMLLEFYAKQAVLQFAQMFVGMFTGSSTATSNADAYASSGLNWGLPKSASVPTIGAKAYSEPAMAAMSNAGAKSSPVTISVSTTIHNDGSATTETRASGDEAMLYREFTERIQVEVAKVVEKESRQGGKLWRAGVQR